MNSCVNTAFRARIFGCLFIRKRLGSGYEISEPNALNESVAAVAYTLILSVVASVIPIVTVYVVFAPIAVSRNKYCDVASPAPATATEIRNEVAAPWLQTTIVLTIVDVDAGTVYRSVSVVASGKLWPKTL